MALVFSMSKFPSLLDHSHHHLIMLSYVILRKGSGTFLAVPWLRLCTCNAGDVGSIPGWGTKIPHAVRCGQKRKKKRKKKKKEKEATLTFSSPSNFYCSLYSHLLPRIVYSYCYNFSNFIYFSVYPDVAFASHTTVTALIKVSQVLPVARSTGCLPVPCDLLAEFSVVEHSYLLKCPSQSLSFSSHLFFLYT